MLAVAFAVMLDVALSVVGAFAAAGAWHEHVVWWNDGAAGTTNRQLTCPVYGDEDRLTNQSVAITLRRLFSLTLGMLPNSPRQFVLLTELDGPLGARLYVAANLLLLGGVAVFVGPARGRYGTCGFPRRRPWCCWPRCGCRRSSGAITSRPPRPPWRSSSIRLHRQQRRWMWLVICLWLGGLCLLAFPVARAAGVLLWLSLLVCCPALAWLGDRKGAEGSSGEDSSDPVRVRS